MDHLKTSGQQRFGSPFSFGPGWFACLAGMVWFFPAEDALANPEGMAVVQGNASAQNVGGHLSITTGQATFINWNSFNIKPGETTSFIQPDKNSVVFNQINDRNPSQIWGNLNANGMVVLYNQSGFYFGPGSVINTGGFIATTAPVTPDMASGGMWTFNGPPPTASIVNYGQIQASAGGSVFLIAEKVDNHGILMAPDGNIGLYAGKEVLVSERPDGRGLSAKVTLPEGSVNNFGKLSADAGTIALHAAVVNQSGVIEAQGVRERGGVIELVASSDLALGPGSVTAANGDPTAAGKAGDVLIKSGDRYSDSPTALVSANGARAGDGGKIEVSANSFSSFDAAITASAAAGSKAGELLLDPENITLGKTGSGSAGNGTVGSTTSPNPGTLELNVDSAFKNKGFSKITLQAIANITLKANTTWNLSDSTGTSEGQNLLILQAGNYINFENGSSIKDANNWSVQMRAGFDFATSTVKDSVSALETRSIYFGGVDVKKLTPLTGTGLIELGHGNVDLQASGSVLVGSGAIRTTAGGSIKVKTEVGDVNAGTANGGYEFRVADYGPVAQLGQIATAAGGDVTIESGGSVTSTPTVPANALPGATGAYGSELGNVRIQAKGSIIGNFTLRNGEGSLLAGIKLDPDGKTIVTKPDSSVGSDQKPVSLSLAKGNWTLRAANDIFINEVRNPQGTFFSNKQNVPSGQIIKLDEHGNPLNPADLLNPAKQYAGNNVAEGKDGSMPARLSFLFDYDPSAGLHLFAGDGITFSDRIKTLPRTTSNSGMGVILPPVLEMEAGASGIDIQRSVVLFPSKKGDLQITTIGDLRGVLTPGAVTGITMSDSGLPGYDTFKDGRSLVPLHANDPTISKIKVSGNLYNLSLSLAKQALLEVAGKPGDVGGTPVDGIYNLSFHARTFSQDQVVEVVAGSVVLDESKTPKVPVAPPGQKARYANLKDITYRGGETTLSLDPTLYEALPEALLDVSRTPPNGEKVGSNFRYDPASNTLTYVGQMSAAIVKGLKEAKVTSVNAAGIPQLDENGEPIVEVLTLTSKQLATIDRLNLLSQSASLAESGLTAEGPGSFYVRSRRLDLGISDGIRGFAGQEELPGVPLLGTLGPKVDVATSGDIDMTSTQISSSGFGGEVKVRSGGNLTVGSSLSAFRNDTEARGIFSTSGGKVDVEAAKDIDIAGSRIAAYNGGSVSVRSLDGDIKTGNGGSGSTPITVVGLNPITGKIEHRLASVPGSGILATTAAAGTANEGEAPKGYNEIGTEAALGDITVKADNGNISSSAAGVLQVSFNGKGNPNAIVKVSANRKDPNDLTRGNVDTGNSGIIGNNVNLAADGNIKGVLIAQNGLDVVSKESVSITALAGGTVNVSASGAVTGTITGGGAVNVAADSISAALVSNQVSTSGDAAGAAVGVANAAAAKSDTKTTDDASATTTKKKSVEVESEDDARKKTGGAKPVLAKSTGRVTVILPGAK